MNYFAGIVNFDGTKVQESDLIKMKDVVTVYQPKDQQIKTMKNVGFIVYSHGRLNQGLTGYFESPCKNIFIFADVRIYNTDKIIEQLELDQKIKNDAELIYRGYMKWGEDCLDYFVGDFAFILWDNQNKRLFCARDHFGVRPFYYFMNDNFLLFSSDLDSMYNTEYIKIIPNLSNLNNFVNGNISSSETFYKNIFRLPQGHKLNFESGKLDIKRYWYPEQINIDRNITFSEASYKFKQLFIKAVQNRTPQNIKVGAEVSGGLDSSSIYSVVRSGIKNIDLSSFSLRFGDYDCDEGIYISSLIGSDKTTHHEIDGDKIDYENNYHLSKIYKMSPHWPIFSTFAMTIPLIEEMAENEVQIGLTGQGGDQLTTGNWGHLTDMLKTFKWYSLYKCLKIYKNSKKTIRQAIIPNLFSYKQIQLIRTLLLKQKISVFFRIKQNSSGRHNKYKNITQKIDIEYFLSDDHALFIDNNPYRLAEKEHGIEFRHPFYDIRLVNFMLSIPWEYKYNYDDHKINMRVLFRDAMKGILPEHIRNRRDKAEFSQVIQDQLKTISLCNIKTHSIVDVIEDQGDLTTNWRKLNGLLWYNNFLNFKKR